MGEEGEERYAEGKVRGEVEQGRRNEREEDGLGIKKSKLPPLFIFLLQYN